MTDHVSVHEAKTHLSRLLRRVEAGEEIVIHRGRDPIAKLVALPADPARRVWGDVRGEMRDDFDAPLEDFDAYR